MQRILFLAAVLMVPTFVPPANAFEPSDIYSAQVVVSGQGEANRRTGFGTCLERVLTRATGDYRLADRPEAKAAAAKAGDFIAAYSYRDLLEGRPVHDEQGTYDRPHNLTCRFKAGPLERLIVGMGARPWQQRRPVIAVLLDVERPTGRHVVAANNERDLAMRQSFGNASNLIALDVVFPPATSALGLPEGATIDPTSAEALAATEASGGDLPLSGRLVWSDVDHGWIADWALARDGKVERWQARGVSFDEAFRVALRGATRVLSGSGGPE